MDLRINAEKTEKIFEALTTALTDDPEKLHTLLDVLRAEGALTGLGYILSNAARRIEEKIVAVSH